MPFILFLKSFENLLFEIMSWLVFYPRTLWRSWRHPLRMMKRSEQELSLPPADQFKDVVSPPIFLLLTVIAAYAIEMAVVGASPIIDNGIGLAALIQDNTTLLLFRLFIVATLPLIAAAFGVAATGRPLERSTLQPLFYAQCFATTPVVLMLSIGASVSRLPQAKADDAAYVILAAAGLFYIGVEASWFTRETQRGAVVGWLWTLAAFASSAAALALAVLLFSGA